MNPEARKAVQVSVKADPTERFCKDFDLGCFELQSPLRCRSGQCAIIDDICYFTLPLKSLCPLCDRLR